MPYNHMYYRHRVAPRVGAWIETDLAGREGEGRGRRSPCGGVD